MKLSIRIRLILAMNLLVVGVGVAVGWAGIAVSGRVIEHRLVDESARNAAGLFGTMRLPFSNELMSRLRQILGTHVAAGPAGQAEITATSLAEPEARQLRDLLAVAPLPRRLDLAGNVYLVGEAEAPQPGPAAAPAGPMRLLLLVPETQVDAAKRAAERSIMLTTLAAIVAATILAIGLSTSITRPIRRLARRMDRLSERAAGDSLAADGAAPDRGPTELTRLAKSFDLLVARLEQARRELARSARLATLGQLSASLAHELRNPLSGIRMNARVLADALARSGAPDSSLDRIIREADRMNLYLDELLGLASGEATPPAPHHLPDLPRIRLDEVGESVLALVEGRTRHGGVEVRRTWDASALAVRADETQIRQVILNLVLNALDAMPAGGTLALATGRAADGAVRFSVADTGKGVHVPEGAGVFEPFVTTKPGGVGLGLYVCRRNIERHRGRIGYDSSGGGATFWFELPAAD